MEDRVSNTEFKDALGHLTAALILAKDDLRQGKMTREQCQQRTAVIVGAARKMNREFSRGHVIMAAPTR